MINLKNRYSGALHLNLKRKLNPKSYKCFAALPHIETNSKTNP